ncbi:hypothetical protein POM88_047457 [Heracleum sosnowskyi]|uniref:Uncharacterized protein n=1 Tax=Heracleum sosnowskyi TaxID=360622 RepID=A0AAD8GT98_9APIA|nr:hypothetical protein POM88_047457 [Heracleum sosnowskyi]
MRRELMASISAQLIQPTPGKKLDLLRGVTPDFGDLEIHEHQPNIPLKFMHKRPRTYGKCIHFLGSCTDEKVMTDSNFTRLLHHRTLLSNFTRLLHHRTLLSERKWLFGILDGFIVNQLPQNFALGGSLFNTMDHKGTKVSTSTQALESVNDLTKHGERYNSNDENENVEEGGAIQRKRRVSESDKYLEKPHEVCTSDYKDRTAIVRKTEQLAKRIRGSNGLVDVVIQ